MTNKQLFIEYFSALLTVIDRQRLRSLLVDLGYQADVITGETLFGVLQEQGDSFAKPFSRLARVALGSPKYEALQRSLRADAPLVPQLSKATSKLTSDQKIDVMNSVLNTVTGILGKGADAYSAYVNQEANNNNALAALLMAQTAQQQAAQQNTNSWLIPVAIGGVVLVVVIVAVILLTRK